MKVTIDRATWSAGQHNLGLRNPPDDEGLDDEPRNALLTRHQQRCCLGFLGRARGLSDDVALDVSVPSDCTGDAQWPGELFMKSGHLAHRMTAPWETVLAILNDFEDIDDATRESWIAAGFRIVLGVEVEFVGEYPPCSP